MFSARQPILPHAGQMMPVELIERINGVERYG
jgi:hypothetical protein